MVSKFAIIVSLALIGTLYVMSGSEPEHFDEKTLLGATAKRILNASKQVSDHVSNSTIAKHEVTVGILGHASTVHSNVKKHTGALWEKVNSNKDFHQGIDNFVGKVENTVSGANQKVLHAVGTLFGKTGGFKKAMGEAVDSTKDTLHQTSKYIGELSGHAVNGVKELSKSGLSTMANNAKTVPSNLWKKLNDHKFHEELDNNMHHYYNKTAEHIEKIWNHEHVKKARDHTHKASKWSVDTVTGHVASFVKKISEKKEEPKKVETKKEEPKKVETKKEEPKKVEPKKVETK